MSSSFLTGLVAALAVSSGQSLAAAAPRAVVFEQAKLEAYLEREFPAKVIGPALERTLTVIFRRAEEVEAQAREAVDAAVSEVSGKGREVVAEALEALVSKDRAAAEAAVRALAGLVNSKGGYWDRAVARFFPDVLARARPQVRVGVLRAYRCTSDFLAQTQDLDATAARSLRHSMSADARNLACEMVRRWAEARALSAVGSLVAALEQYQHGRKVELSESGRAQAERFKKALERELLARVGSYRELMERIRRSLERLVEELPATPAGVGSPAAAPAPGSSEGAPAASGSASE